MIGSITVKNDTARPTRKPRTQRVFNLNTWRSSNTSPQASTLRNVARICLLRIIGLLPRWSRKIRNGFYRRSRENDWGQDELRFAVSEFKGPKRLDMPDRESAQTELVRLYEDMQTGIAKTGALLETDEQLFKEACEIGDPVQSAVACARLCQKEIAAQENMCDRYIQLIRTASRMLLAAGFGEFEQFLRIGYPVTCGPRIQGFQSGHR